MDEHNFDYQLDSDILRYVRFKSRQLAGRYGFSSDDGADIQQELVLDYLRRRSRFDSRRCSLRTFARLIINNRVATIIKAQMASCRDYRACRPSNLHLTYQNAHSQDLAEVLGMGDSSGGRPFETMLNARLDIERTVARLPTVLADLCRLLMVCDTSVEAASRAGMSRATVYRSIARLRVAFTEAGLSR